MKRTDRVPNRSCDIDTKERAYIKHAVTLKGIKSTLNTKQPDVPKHFAIIGKQRNKEKITAERKNEEVYHFITGLDFPTSMITRSPIKKITSPKTVNTHDNLILYKEDSEVSLSYDYSDDIISYSPVKTFSKENRIYDDITESTEIASECYSSESSTSIFSESSTIDIDNELVSTQPQTPQIINVSPIQTREVFVTKVQKPKIDFSKTLVKVHQSQDLILPDSITSSSKKSNEVQNSKNIDSISKPCYQSGINVPISPTAEHTDFKIHFLQHIDSSTPFIDTKQKIKKTPISEHDLLSTNEISFENTVETPQAIKINNLQPTPATPKIIEKKNQLEVSPVRADSIQSKPEVLVVSPVTAESTPNHSNTLEVSGVVSPFINFFDEESSVSNNERTLVETGIEVIPDPVVEKNLEVSTKSDNNEKVESPVEEEENEEEEEDEEENVAEAKHEVPPTRKRENETSTKSYLLHEEEDDNIADKTHRHRSHHHHHRTHHANENGEQHHRHHHRHRSERGHGYYETPGSVRRHHHRHRHSTRDEYDDYNDAHTRVGHKEYSKSTSLRIPTKDDLIKDRDELVTVYENGKRRKISPIGSSRRSDRNINVHNPQKQNLSARKRNVDQMARSGPIQRKSLVTDLEVLKTRFLESNYTESGTIQLSTRK